MNYHSKTDSGLYRYQQAVVVVGKGVDAHMSPTMTVARNA
jgi:hypothetical protein